MSLGDHIEVVASSSSTPCGGSEKSSKDCDGLAVVLERKNSDGVCDAFKIEGGPQEEGKGGGKEEGLMPQPISVKAGFEGNGEQYEGQGNNENDGVMEGRKVFVPSKDLRAEKNGPIGKVHTKYVLCIVYCLCV